MQNEMYPLDSSLLEDKIGYEFKNKRYLKTALSHSSYTNELRSKGESIAGEFVQCNERLEFLGDSVLSLICSSYLFEHYKRLLEGDLTKIRASSVCEGALYEYAKDLSLGDYLYLGHGEERTNGRERRSILADAFEALLAAIYLDGGLTAARKFALPYLKKKIEVLTKTGASEDCKTLLQQFIQQNRGDLLEYNMVKEEGPAHDKCFYFEVRLNNNIIGRGSGGTKREAEQNAAREALMLFGELPREKQ